ncbi:MAG: hypothetical protein A49_20830 [Methyloceanibacter sp.]|nr:MAG: hypothetical protein A49_20830 [Methyloceanibacter sp.]
MPELNWFYVLAVTLLAAGGISGYLGTQWSSDQSDERIVSKIDSLRTELRAAGQQPDSPEKTARIEHVNSEYEALAKMFYQNREARAAKEELRSAEEKAADVERKSIAETYLRSVAREAEQLASAYNKAAGREVIKVTDGINHHLPHVLLEFEGPSFWAARVTTYPDGIRAVQFLRLESPDGSPNYDALMLTDDSLNLVLLGDEFGLSLNSNISSAMKANVTDGLNVDRQPKDNLEPFATKVLQRIIEFQLLPKT